MRRTWLAGVAAMAACLCAPIAHADLADVLAQYVGYTIAASKGIAGYVDPNGKKSDDFEGCNYGRQIIFDDGSALTCSSYSYEYAYHPTAVILVRSVGISGQHFASVVMIVEGESYDMQPVPLK